jgi:hypothetical protein
MNPDKEQTDKIEIEKHKQRKQTKKPIRPKRQYKNRRPHYICQKKHKVMTKQEQHKKKEGL